MYERRARTYICTHLQPPHTPACQVYDALQNNQRELWIVCFGECCSNNGMRRAWTRLDRGGAAANGLGNLTKQKKTVFIVDLCELLFQMSLKHLQKDFSLTGFTSSTSFIIFTDSIKFSGSLYPLHFKFYWTLFFNWWWNVLRIYLACFFGWVGWKIQWELSLSPDFRIIQQHSSPKSRGENSESIALHQPIEGVGFK